MNGKQKFIQNKLASIFLLKYRRPTKTAYYKICFGDCPQFLDRRYGTVYSSNFKLLFLVIHLMIRWINLYCFWRKRLGTAISEYWVAESLRQRRFASPYGLARWRTKYLFCLGRCVALLCLRYSSNQQYMYSIYAWMVCGLPFAPLDTKTVMCGGDVCSQ